MTGHAALAYKALKQGGIGAAVVEHVELVGDVVPADEVPEVTGKPRMADLGGVYDLDRRFGATLSDE